MSLFKTLKNLLSRNSFIFLIFIGLLTSCSVNSTTDIRSRKKDDKFVIATFTVLADIARNIAGERLIVKSITKTGSEIHSYQFTPSDLIRAKGAELIIENGLGLELWIDKFVSSSGNIPRLVLSDGMEPLYIEGDVYSGKPNPHAWMSPKRTIHYVNRIVKAFIEIDPTGIDVYQENASRYKNQLLKLDQELNYYLSFIPPDKRILVSCEGAFSYLAKDYGMEEAYLWPVNAESKVTPKRMANLIKIVKEKKVPAIFCETTVSSEAQREVAKESGSIFGGNFFVDSLSGPDGPASTLLDLHLHNVLLLRQGLIPESFDE